MSASDISPVRVMSSSCGSDATVQSPVPGGARPRPRQRGADDDQARRQADPDPNDAPAGDERERPADRQAQSPVGRRGSRSSAGASRRGRAARRWRSPARRRTPRTSRRRRAASVPVRITSGSRVNRPISSRGSSRKASAVVVIAVDAQQDRRPPRVLGAGAVAPADGVADADRGRRGDAERHHEGEPGQLQRDLVRGDRGRALARRHRRRHREAADLEHHLQHRRHAEAQQHHQVGGRPAACAPRQTGVPAWWRRSCQTIAPSGTIGHRRRGRRTWPRRRRRCRAPAGRDGRRSAPSCRWR